MQAIEFETTTINGQITLPVQYQSFYNKKLKIIVLVDESVKKNKRKPIEPNDHFFDICGIWKDRDITVESLRKAAWRTTEW